MLVERDNIAIFGRMNAGKSSIMNLFTESNTSIVDAKPGTTADTKVTLMEIHGIGPVKLYDTAGFDEEGELGEKKRKKTISDLKECDLAILVINPAIKDYEPEKSFILQARELDKQIIIVFNMFQRDTVEDDIHSFKDGIPLLKFYPKIIIEANNSDDRQELLNFIIKNFESKNHSMQLLPFLQRDEFYILNIPMDEEAPSNRYLRPQALCEEYITRNWAYPVAYRMDLGKARHNDAKIQSLEKARFLDFIHNFQKKPKLIITDSQAMDIMSSWCPDDISLTTFSIVMINFISRGRLAEFVEGVKQMETIQAGDKILIVEACNHSRIAEDIGTVQIPKYIQKHYPGVEIEHNFGREFQENNNLDKYKLIIHCGGCMISSQKILARIRDLATLGIPYTNYGVFLSYIQGKEALQKVLTPWGV